jgi:adenylate cyclase
VRIRRLRILGVALGLSLAAAALGVALYLLPPAVGAPVNRVADFVVVNDSKRWVDDHVPLGRFAFPNRDDENQHLRLIAIDEASMNAPNDPQHPGLGQFPWPRRLYGQLLTRLQRAGAKVVAFDVDFFEPSPDPRDDAVFAAGMRAQPTILPFGIATTSTGLASVELPPPQLAHAAHALGTTTIDTPGGLVLGQPLVITERDQADHVTAVYASLAAQTAATYLGTQVSAGDAWSARLGDERVPLDGDHALLMLPFQSQQTIDLGGAGGPASRAGTTVNAASFFQSVSFVDALHFDDATLRAFANGDALVIGSTAQALGDFVNTPYGRYPGVFANLRMMDQLMRGEFITRSRPWLDIGLIILIPLLVGFAVTQLPATTGVATSALIVILYSAAAIALYGYSLHWIDLIHVDGATILAALFVALYRTVTEGADKRVIREMFGKHVSPAIVDHLLASDDPLKSLNLTGKRVRVTIFYSDIRGFTAMSEKMTPEQIYGALNEYFEEMCALVFAYGGYVDKFIGDCVMAVFSAPNPLPDDPYRAVRSAWEQQQRIHGMMGDWGAQGRQIFTVGMGLNTGEVVMGNLGSSDRLNYTVIGDSVNTASRLYNVAKGGQIIISESTYEEVKDRFIVNELTPVFVKGKVLALRNFEVLGLLEPGQPNTSTLLDPAAMPEALVAADH